LVQTVQVVLLKVVLAVVVQVALQVLLEVVCLVAAAVAELTVVVVQQDGEVVMEALAQ
jgi:hypothetical protein